MDQAQFWQIIENSGKGNIGDPEAQLAALENELRKLTPTQIEAFQRHFTKFMDQAYSWDLWGAAYLIGGGCSDDSFLDFRSWLISQGEQVYQLALRDSDSLAELVDEDGDAFFEVFQYAASDIYQEKAGKEMPFIDREVSSEPIGEEWQEDDEKELRRRWPKLAAKFLIDDEE